MCCNTASGKRAGRCTTQGGGGGGVWRHQHHQQQDERQQWWRRRSGAKGVRFKLTAPPLMVAVLIRQRASFDNRERVFVDKAATAGRVDRAGFGSPDFQLGKKICSAPSYQVPRCLTSSDVV